MLTSTDFNQAINPNFYYVGEKVIVELHSTTTGKTEYKTGTVDYDDYMDVHPWEREITVKIDGNFLSVSPASVRSINL